jgi:DNA-binding XRE family transcriptional regulator
MKICCTVGCSRPVFASGMCGSHYYRMRKYGDPFGGRTPPGVAGAYLNNVVLSHDGNSCLIWPFGRGSDGYAKIWRDGQMRVVSRIVCELVNGAPPTPSYEAAHSCGNGHKGCVSPRHMSWKTVAENQADRLIHGTHARGHRHGAAKLTEAEAREIRRLRGAETQTSLAARFGVTFQTISDIQRGKRWAWLAELEAERSKPTQDSADA